MPYYTLETAIGILRACGGSSHVLLVVGLHFFVFSAHAEVVPKKNNPRHKIGRILRARGGSSRVDYSYGCGDRYSPRTRR